MKLSSLSLFRACLCLALLNLVPVGESFAVTFSVSPAVVGNQYAGFITFQVGGLNNGETVYLEKYLDANANGIIDPGEFAVQRFKLVDGKANTIGGATNINVPWDMDGASGAITTQLNFQSSSELSVIAGHYLYRLSTPTNSWTPITNPFLVTNSITLQAVSGKVVSSGTNVPYAIVVVLSSDSQGGNQLVSGGVADGTGSFNVGVAPGQYMVFATQSNYVASLSGPMVSVSPGTSVSTDLSLISATSAVAGQVVDGNDPTKIVPGIFLTLESLEGFLTITFSDINGNFSAPVTASAWKLNPQEPELRLHGYLNPASSVVVTNHSGNLSGVSVPVFKASALVYGKVLDEQNHPYPGVNFNVRDEGGTFDDGDATSDLNGNYVITLSAETWNLRFPPNNPALAGHVISPGGGRTTLPSGTSLFVNFSVKVATNRIAGHVKTSQNTAVAGVGVSAVDDSGFQPASVDTDSAGFYSLPVANGTWSVVVNCNGGDDSLNNQGLQCVSPVTTNINGVDAVLDFTVPVANADIRGRAIDDQGQAIAGMNIFAFPTNSGVNFQSTTDAGGYFDIPVVGGTYNVQLNTDPTFGVAGLGLVGPSLPINIADGASISNLVLVGRHITGTIQVMVERASNLTPVSGIGIYCSTFIGGTNYLTGNLASDASGKAALRVFSGQWQVGLSGFQLSNAGFTTPVSQFVTNTSGTNFVTFQLLARAASPGISVTPTLQNNHFQLSVNGVAGQNYTLQYSLDLKSWTSFQITNPPVNTFLMTDFAATNRARFYRVLVGP